MRCVLIWDRRCRGIQDSLPPSLHMQGDWASFLGHEIEKREQRRVQAWRVFGYSAIGFGATGWYLVSHPRVVPDTSRLAALGLAGAIFLLAVSPLLDRFLLNLQPEALPATRLRLKQRRLDTFLRKIPPGSRFQWATFADGLAAILAASLAGMGAVLSWGEWLTFAVSLVFCVVFGFSAIFLLFSRKRAHRVRQWLDGQNFEEILGWYGTLVIPAWLTFGVYFLLSSMQEEEFVQEGVYTAAMCAAYLLALVGIKLVILLSRDNSVVLLEQLRHARLFGAEDGAEERLADAQLARAYALIDLLRTRRLLASLSLEQLLTQAERFDRLLVPANETEEFETRPAAESPPAPPDSPAS